MNYTVAVIYSDAGYKYKEYAHTGELELEMIGESRCDLHPLEELNGLPSHHHLWTHMPKGIEARIIKLLTLPNPEKIVFATNALGEFEVFSDKEEFEAWNKRLKLSAQSKSFEEIIESGADKHHNMEDFTTYAKAIFNALLERKCILGQVTKVA